MHHEAALYDLIRGLDECGGFDEIEARADVVSDQIYALVVSMHSNDDPEICDQVAQEQVQRLFGGDLRYDGWGAGMGWYEVFFYRKDPKRKQQWDAGDYTSVAVSKNTDPRHVRSNPAGRHIECGDLPAKQCRQLQHVYESARDRGFSKKRAAQQAWSTVNRTMENNPKSKKITASTIAKTSTKMAEAAQGGQYDYFLGIDTSNYFQGQEREAYIIGWNDAAASDGSMLRIGGSMSNPRRRKANAPYVIWQHSTNGRYYVSREGFGSAVTSPKGYEFPVEAWQSARDMMFKRGEDGKATIEFEESLGREPNPAHNRAMIIAQRLARGES